MSNHLLEACKDGDAGFGASSQSHDSHQSCWMSRWTHAPSKQGSLIVPHAHTFSREEGLDHNKKRIRRSLHISSNIPTSYGAIRNSSKAETVGLAIDNLTIRAQNVGRERPDCVPILGHSINGKNTWKRAPVDPSCIDMVNSSCATKSGPSSTHVADDADNPGKITLFKGNFSNNDFASLDQEMNKCGKYSAIVAHERSGFRPLNDPKSEDMRNEAKSKCFASQSGAPRPYNCRRNFEGLPGPVRNVNAVNYVGNSHGRPPFFSTRHVLFTSQTGMAHESTQNRGVKIQPLWSSTDSERDNMETPRGERSVGLSTETDTMDTLPLLNKNDFSVTGIFSSPVAKDTMRERSLPMVSVAPLEEKVRGKLPVITGTTETNSMDGIEPIPSRTQSLEAEHLVYCAEQPSECKSMPRINECAFQEQSSRWVKRLKLSSSEMGEYSYAGVHMLTKQNSASPDTPLMDKHQREESPIPPTQTMVPAMNGEPSSRKNKNPIFDCSWIQRWCQDRPIASVSDPSKGVVICEPDDSSKLSLGVLEKRLFPSIAAVALMGKSMDGFHSCKFTKRGSLVVWNTEC